MITDCRHRPSSVRSDRRGDARVLEFIRQVIIEEAGEPCGDYGLVVDGQLVASVERKSLADLVASLISGKLRYQVADLAALPRAAVVVEDR